MSKRIILLISAILWNYHTQAQIQDTLKHTYAALPDYLFPSGLLLDQSAPQLLIEGTTNDPEYYTGQIPGKLLVSSSFEWAYHALYYAQRIKSNGLLASNTPAPLMNWKNFKALDSAHQTTVDVPIHLAWINYQKMLPIALDSGYLTFDGDQFNLLDSVTYLDPNQSIYRTNNSATEAQKAFQTKTTFLAGSNYPTHYTDTNSITLTFKLPSNLIQTNTSGLGAFEIDFEDGRGFISVIPNQIYTITYSMTASNTEHDEKELRIRATSGGLTLESRFRINIVYNTPTPDNIYYTHNLVNPPCLPGLNPLKRAKLSVWKGKGNNQITKPLILVEGFEGAVRPYGYLSFESVSSGYIFNDDGDRIYQHMEKLSWLYDSLHNEGFDIVHLDFIESKLSIEQNAQHLVRALHWIDSQHPTEGTTVIGASMGGLISRVALNMLEDAHCCNNIIAFGTFDSPHNGAFIPIGLQVTARNLAQDLPLIPVAYQPWKKALNSKAAREMLVEHLDPSAQSDRSHLSDLLGTSIPQSMRTFAISNGNDLLTPSALQDPAKRWLDGGIHRWVTYKHAVGAHADSVAFNYAGYQMPVPVWGSSSMAHEHVGPNLFVGSPLLNVIRYMRIQWYSNYRVRMQALKLAYGQSSLPNASMVLASIEPYQKKTNTRLQQMHAAIAKHLNIEKEQSYSKDFAEIAGSRTNTGEAFTNSSGLFTVFSEDHTFIPAFSALDVGELYRYQRIRGKMNIIPFDTYLSPGLMLDQSGANQDHIEVDNQIVDWVLATLDALYNNVPQFIPANYNISKVKNSWSPYRSQLGGTTIGPNGHLSLGKLSVVSQSKPSSMADSKQNLKFFVGQECVGTQLVVQGKLTIGDGMDRISIVRVKNGSELILSQGSTMEINQDSKLIVEKGGALIIHPGAQVLWNDGIIELEGDVELVGGANLNLQGAGTLNLYGPIINAQSGGSLSMKNSVINIMSDSELPLNLSSTVFTDSRFRFLNKASMIIHNAVHLSNNTFEYVGSNKSWLGIDLVGVATVDNCTFNGGAPALNLRKTSSVDLGHNTFNDALIGILGLAEPLNFFSNQFYNCATGAKFYSDLVASQNVFTQCDFGIRVMNQSNVELFQNTFNNCSEVAYEGNRGSSRLECNQFYNNTIAVLQKEGGLNLGNSAGNIFNYNLIGIQVNDVFPLALNNGHNSIVSNFQYDIYGSIHSGGNLSKDPNGYYILANINGFTNSSNSQINYGKSKVNLVYNVNQSPSTSLCPTKDRPGKQNIDFTKNFNEELEISVFPNPSKYPQLNIEITESGYSSEIEVINSLGQLMAEKKLLPYETNVSFTNIFSPGTYILRWVHPLGIQQVKWVYQP